MDQTDELPYEAALQAGQTPVVGGVPTYKGSTPVGDTSSGLMDYESVKPISTEKEIPFEEIKPTTSSSGTPDSTTAMVGKSFLTGLQTSILDPVARLQASISDYLTHPEDLNSQEGGEVTPQQAAAAKLIGADVGKVWGPILKMSPKQLAETSDRADRLFGLDPEEQKKRAEAIAQGDVYSGPVEGLLQHSAVRDLLGSVYNPNKSNTLLFHKVNEIAHLMDITQHPDKYDPEAVKAAQEVIDAYKEQASKSTWTKVKESLGEMAKHPLTLVNTTLADPELLLAPEVKVGTAAYGSKAALAAEASLKAQRYAKLADAIAKSSTVMPDVAAAASAKAEHYGAEAAKLNKGLSEVGKKAQLLDVASAGATGAGVNVGISAEQQKAQQGYVQKGTLGPAAVIGGALGAGLSALGGRSIKSPKLPEDLTTRVAPGEPTKVGPNVENVPDVNAGKLPGEPLSPATPINKGSHVPYYGGVDASGKVIHIDEKTPENLPIKSLGGKKANIPVLKTVAYHESVEFPLMHMEGPIAPDTLSQLYTRIGKEGKIPQEVVDKLKAGKSLSYPEAHEIATLAENHLVRTLYKVNPKVYQDALRPYIKEVGEANKEATGADIPPGLDTKPYDDMGHPEVLMGQGNRPDVDLVKNDPKGLEAYKYWRDQFGKYSFSGDNAAFQALDKAIKDDARKEKTDTKYFNKYKELWAKYGPEVLEEVKKKYQQDWNTSTEKSLKASEPDYFKEQGAAANDQVGKVDKRLLATGVATGLGATAGAVLSPTDQKKAGALAGGLGGLLLSMNMWGDSIPRKGMGKQEGMFAGPGSRGYDLRSEKIARKMEELGKTPEQIHLATGMHKGKVGNWIREFSDKDMRIMGLPAPGTEVPLRMVMEHSKFAREYPEIFNKLKVSIISDPSVYGGFSSKDNLIYLNPTALSKAGEDIRGTLVHELQHAVQNAEGFPIGSNSAREGKALNKVLNYLYDRNETLYQEMVRLELAGDLDKIPKLEEKYNKTSALIGEIESSGNKAYRNYQRQAGEVQSRNTESRLSLSEEQRSTIHPEKTQDIPTKEQFVRYKDAHELSLSEHLRKSGDMDEEGHLYGMTLDEDRLPNEQAIISRAKMGDQQAITTLYKKYMPRLERTLRSMMRDAGPRLGIDSEDIASQAFMKATQALPDFKGDSAFYTWLYSIARNEALNAIGKGNRQVPTTSMFAGGSKVGPEGGSAMTAAEGGIESAGGSPIRPGVEAIASTQDTPEAMALAQQASNMVRYAISKLPQEIREAVKMKDLVGMTEQEIAAAQGVPVGTVKSRLSRGRDMLQQSIKRGHGAQFRSQGGFATPEALKKLSKIALLGGGGATLGAMYLNPENKLAGAWAGAAIALVGGEVKWNRLFPSLKEMMAKDDRINVNTLLDNYDAALATAERTVAQVQYKIDKLSPGRESQRKITYWLDGDRSVQLTPNEMESAKIARQFYDSLGQAAHQKGVLEDFLQNYVNHEWGDSAKAKELQDQIASTFATNMSPKDRHALARKFLTLAQGKEAGLVPRTENINELIGIYSNSMSKAMANKTLLDALTVKVLDPTAGVKAVMPAGKAPYNFVPIAPPQLTGVRVHPRIAPSLGFLFHTTKRGVITSAVEGLNTATKRLEVSLSLFHVKALIDAFLGANPLSSPIKNLVNIATSMAGKSAAHKEYLAGGPGDVTDLLLRNGLKVNPRKGQLSDEDIKTGFYEALDSLQQFMDQVVPGIGKPLALMKKANKISDKFIWENVHTGLKATTAMNAYERLTRAHAKELLKDPNYKMPSADELARQAASFTNDTFGGLNWRRLADDATTKIGRNLSLVLASPLGRRISQVMMFAPDWTYSTIRSFLKAVDTGSGIKGLLQPKTLADLHRQYLIRSSIIYLTLYNALNVVMSGHPIWDNKDPLTVDLGNGERMQANKHFMETPHMILHPAKFAIGKLGIIPSEVLEQALHKEYLTTGQMPEMKGGRLAHIGKRFLPFAGQSFQQQGVPEMMANLAGFPIYGTHPPRTPEEVAAAKRKKKESAEKAKKTRRENKLRKMYGE